MKRNLIIGFVLAIFCFSVLVQATAAQIIIPAGTTVIGDESFSGDRSLTGLVLQEGLLRIGSKAFANTSLRSVTLPFSLEYFAKDAFDGCPSGFKISVYEGSGAAALCSQYGITAKIIKKHKVGISLPTKELQRWVRDGERMKNGLEEKGCEVDLKYASGSTATQYAQLNDMIDSGCEVLIIADAANSGLNSALEYAAEKGVKVIAYDRLLMDTDAVDYYVTFDNYTVGAVQGVYVRDRLNLKSAAGPFYMEFTAGDPGDNNSLKFYQGAIDVLRPYINSGKIVVRSGMTEFSDVATRNWSTNNAQSRAEDIIAAYYTNGKRLDAWLCSNDSTAMGVTYALENNYNVSKLGWPIITSQDCDFGNTRNIIAGKQSMSIFRETRRLAVQTVKMVGQILAGIEVDVNDTSTYYNNNKYVPSFLCDPVVVDKNNYHEVLIEAGYYSEDQLQ